MLDIYGCSYKDFSSPFYDPVAGEAIVTPARLKTQLEQGHSLIVGVNVHQQTGALNQGATGHWVVVDDIAPQGINDGQVLLYNPMPNSQEIYSYETFIQAAANFNNSSPMPFPNEIRATGIWVDGSTCK